MHSTLRAKLSPEHLQGVAPSTVSVLGVLFSQPYTTPAFDDLRVMPDGSVFLLESGNELTQVFIGPLSHVQAELLQASAAAGLTTRELKQLEDLFAVRTAGNRLYH
jgi:hypothetical protein